ncbi:hypothetical protein DH2020_005815 [Rehmannia glutinosa]|uniref:S-protein homolog n=1 Tax=Rehmannia glutinosa TaxID=99300 RepID=A0ABR0XH68_REHGL
MRTWKENLFVSFALFLLTNSLIITSEAILEKAGVIVTNKIPNENITIHCYSSEDDLGVHNLAYGSSFSWNFRINFFRSTKFYCDISTRHGYGNYGVFTPNLKRDFCYNQCEWSVHKDGPCVKQRRSEGPSWCQNWKVPQPPSS